MKKLLLITYTLLIAAIFGCVTLTYSQTKKVAGGKSKAIKRVVLVDQDDRKWIEKQLLNGKYEHDGSGKLLYIGTIESVPALLAVVKHYKVGPGGIMICTRAHALAALAKITNQSLGSSYEAWASWWNTNKTELLKKK